MLTQTLTISAGATSLSIFVTALDDNILEVVESFTVTLSNSTSGLILGARNSAIVNIVDPDGE